jgi:hypothetical protein
MCVVAKQIWVNISDCLDIDCVNYFESTGKCWLSNKKYSVINIFTSTAIFRQALKAKKSPLLLGWPLERCEWSTDEDSKLYP